MIRAHVAKLEAPRQLVFHSEELDPAKLGAREVLCRTEVSVISPGTELAAYTGAPPLRPGMTYPRLVGYCNVARVLHCGASVTGITTGDRVLTFSSHRSHFVIPADDALAILPADIASEDAACAYLFHLGYSGIVTGEVRLGSTVLVVGLGVLGLSAVAMSALSGARTLAISDHTHLHALARSLGAEVCYTRAQLNDLVRDLGEKRADVVITTSNSWADWPVALQSAGMRGTVVVLGFPGRQERVVPSNPLDSQHFYARQLRIVSAGLMPEHADSRGFLPFNERANLQRILRWMQQGRLQSKLFLSGEYSWRELPQAYEALLSRAGSPISFLLRWDTAQS